MRFNVPQFIEIEDKIFGPLTWKQFLYVGGGFGMAVVLFLTNFVLFIFIGLPLAALAAALAFYPVNNRPFSIFLESAFNYLLSDHQYFWQSDNSTVYSKKGSGAGHIAPQADMSPKQNQTKLASLSRKLELEALEQKEATTAEELNITN